MLYLTIPFPRDYLTIKYIIVAPAVLEHPGTVTPPRADWATLDNSIKKASPTAYIGVGLFVVGDQRVTQAPQASSVDPVAILTWRR